MVQELKGIDFMESWDSRFLWLSHCGGVHAIF